MDKMPEDMTRAERLWQIRQYAKAGAFSAAQKFYLNNSRGISLDAYREAVR